LFVEIPSTNIDNFVLVYFRLLFCHIAQVSIIYIIVKNSTTKSC